MHGQVYTRIDTVLTKTFALAISSTPTQISGGTTVLAGFTLAPSSHRQGIMVYNPTATPQYVGFDNTVTGAGVDAVDMIPAYGNKFLPYNGTVPLWLVSSVAATANVFEVQ